MKQECLLCLQVPLSGGQPTATQRVGGPHAHHTRARFTASGLSPEACAQRAVQAMEMGTEAETSTPGSPISDRSRQAPALAQAREGDSPHVGAALLPDARLTALAQLVETRTVQLQQRDAQLALLVEGTLCRDSRATESVVRLEEQLAPRDRAAAEQQLARVEDEPMHGSEKLKELPEGPVLQNAQRAEVSVLQTSQPAKVLVRIDPQLANGPVKQNVQLANEPVLQNPQNEKCQSCNELGTELQQKEAQLAQRDAQIRALAQRGQQARSLRLGTETELRCAKVRLAPNCAFLSHRL